MSKDKNAGKAKSNTWMSIYWWTFLIVAVLAVPSVAFVVAALVPSHGIWQIIVFVIACWISTFIGMKLMNTSNGPTKK